MRAPTVDGDLSDPQWDAAATVEAAVATDHAGSVLQSLRAIIVEDRLYLAVEGTIADGHALVVYVDGEIGGPEGVTNLGTLTDRDGALDERLSRPLDLPSDFAADVAVGTTLTPRTVVGFDDAAGWRDIATNPAELRWLAGEEAPLACSSMGCEASIAMASLAGDPPREIGVFVRIAPAAGLTNQTLPEDAPARPEHVSTFLTVPDGVPPLPEDAGVADAGLDAGAPLAPVIDGVIDPAEWADALLETNPRTAEGTAFAGNALRSLRAIRDSDRLYIAIEGELSGDNGILMYVDARVGGVGGVTSNTNQLLDATGAVDEALSFKSIVLHPEIAIDFAWAALDMSRAASGIDDRMGWREVATNPFDFPAISATDAPTVCSATACETSIRLSDLGALADEPIGLFVRLGATRTDALSNQTLPIDLDAESVSVFAELR